MSDPSVTYAIMPIGSAEAIARILTVDFPDARTALDATYGSGKFWSRHFPVSIRVTGMDLDPARARDVVGDFRAMPFSAGSFDVVIFDPPYLADPGKGKAPIIGARFGSFPTTAALEAAVRLGLRESWRVARLGVIYKCLPHTHSSRMIPMDLWGHGELGPYYSRLFTPRSSKINDPKWGRQLSIRNKHAEYWSYRKGSQAHTARRAS